MANLARMRANGRTKDAGEILLEAEHVAKYYGTDAKNEQQRVLVLDDISIQVKSGEFVAILGPSGSGKSTLLRILGGLIRASDGSVRYRGTEVTAPNTNLALIFQTFALFPWLTVLENVELGLEAQPNLTRTQKTKRALAAIDTIGLDGFEDAYPKELSGGMRQRVGFARALVVQPELLFMDEPFSALDVLTAENLRNELMRLWREGRIPTKAILLITHSIEEAVFMADRIVVMGHDPGRIRAILTGIPLAERGTKTPAAEALIDLVYTIITQPDEDAADLMAGRVNAGTGGTTTPERAKSAAKNYQTLPHVKIGVINGLAERVLRAGGREDLFVLGRELQLEIDDLLPIVEAIELLGFGEATGGDLVLSDAGKQLAEGDDQTDKTLFRQQALAHIALIRQIADTLATAEDHELDSDEIREQLEEHFSPDEAERQFGTAIDWARYAELFAYDDESGLLYLEDALTGE